MASTFWSQFGGELEKRFDDFAKSHPLISVAFSTPMPDFVNNPAVRAWPIREYGSLPVSPLCVQSEFVRPYLGRGLRECITGMATLIRCSIRGPNVYNRATAISTRSIGFQKECSDA
jgi:hypothetical protein